MCADFIRTAQIVLKKHSKSVLKLETLKQHTCFFCVVMDNCSVHHNEPVITLLRQAGIVALFLPPYSPDLNPLEEVFSYVKGYLKKHDSILQYIPDPSDVIKDAFDSLTIAHCNAFIHHCVYN